MRVLILGASGFIGFPAAQAFVRAGHIVYGVTRSQEKAKQLAGEEIIPIVAEVADRTKWLPLVATLDAVVDALGGSDLQKICSDNFNETVAAARELRPAHAPKLGYIYTSGTWVHGDNRTDIITDTTPIVSSIELTSWRPAVEQVIATSSAVNGLVIRPSLLYGRSGSLLALMFKSAYEGKAKWFGTPGGRFSLIHQDDLATMFVLAAEKSSILGGTIFDAANDFSESVDEILQKLVQISGASGYEYLQPTNPFQVALGTSSSLRPYLARSLLGWHPRKAGLIDHLDIYYSAWKASEGL
ncbi:NAD(P)-binding protein [Sparassis latifolia]